MSRYTIAIDSGAPLWARRLAEDLNASLNRVRLDIKPPSVAKADLPHDDSLRLAIVPDEAGGITLAFFDATQWRRVTDNAVVS